MSEDQMDPKKKAGYGKNTFVACRRRKHLILELRPNLNLNDYKGNLAFENEFIVSHATSNW
jgi:hypothetical protein